MALSAVKYQPGRVIIVVSLVTPGRVIIVVSLVTPGRVISVRPLLVIRPDPPGLHREVTTAFRGVQSLEGSPVTSGWGPWGPWSDCSKTCGVGGMQTRKRTWEYAPGYPNRLTRNFTMTDHMACAFATVPCESMGMFRVIPAE
ncbi:hypothetical protein ACOMHN_018397 [Nucella lapillus]